MKMGFFPATISLLLGACVAKTPTPDVSKTLRVQYPSEPTHLNPYLAEKGSEIALLQHTQRTLLSYDAKLELVGDAALDWTWLNEDKTLKLRLREGIFWSDDSALMACDYRRGLMAALSAPLGPSPFADLLADVVGFSDAIAGNIEILAKSLRCDDNEKVLEIDVTSARPWKILHALAFVVSAPLKESIKDFGNGTLSSGPFRVLEWKKGRSLLLVDKEDFKIELLFVRDANTAFVMYEKNDLDVLTDIPAALLAKLRLRPDFYRFPMMATYYVAFGLEDSSAFLDSRARRALALSAGREEMPSLLQGGEVAAYSLTPPALLPEQLYKQFKGNNKENPAKAKELWQAFVEDNPDFKNKEISLFYSSGDRHHLLMERLQNNWRRHLGVRTRLEPMEWNSYVDRLKNKAPQVFRYAWTAVYPDPRFFLNLLAPSSPQNFGAWANDFYQKQLASLNSLEKYTSSDWLKHVELESRMIGDEAPIIPLYHYAKNVMSRIPSKQIEVNFQGFLDLGALRPISE